MNEPVVAVALSGGVDSLVSGYLLKKQYKHVFGIHFITGYEKNSIDLNFLETELGFPVTKIDLSEDFEEKVVQYFINTYLQGKTPNPCIICNKLIKFGVLLKHAQNMGADYLATGHYANVVNQISCPKKYSDNYSGKYLDPGPNSEINHYCLKKGEDVLKDQSYFLSMLSSRQLGKIIFPLAQMNKKDVKLFAKAKNIRPIHKKESQDICFIHNRDFAKFIMNKKKMTPQSGDIKDIDNKVVGHHKGLHKFTIGQRRGINCPAKEPYYVQNIDIKDNVLKVCFKNDLLKTKLNLEDIVWNGNKNLQLSDESIIIKNIMTKIRYSHKGGLSTLSLNKNCGEVIFEEPQNAITPGQAAVFYRDSKILGAGIIQ
jgi:tRNA-uridine 2-sulfurtransferase